jgi:hypothetical protein
MSELFQTMFNDVFFIPDKHTFWEDKWWIFGVNLYHFFAYELHIHHCYVII